MGTSLYDAARSKYRPLVRVGAALAVIIPTIVLTMIGMTGDLMLMDFLAKLGLNLYAVYAVGIICLSLLGVIGYFLLNTLFDIKINRSYFQGMLLVAHPAATRFISADLTLPYDPPLHFSSATN
jgi:hypothetical protein